MNIFGKGTFTWWQMGIFKFSVLAFGIVIGAYWSEMLSSYLGVLLALSILSGVYIGYLWLKQ